MELHLGKMSSQEIAEWMGISYTTFKQNHKKKLEYLENFAKFEVYHGGIDIQEIYISEYVKKLSEEDLYYINAIKETDNGLATISGITRKLKKDKKEFYDIAEKTLYKRMSKAGERTFGKTHDPESKGTHGTRHYIWAIKVDNYNHYRLMTQAERTIYEQIRDQYCKDKSKNIEQMALLLDAYKRGEISAEEYADNSFELSFFGEVLFNFKVQTGYQLVRVTEHELL